MEHVINMGPVIVGKMLHAWISLAAAIVIFILTLKFMAGGKLAAPILLIGLGALIDAMIGFFPPHQGHMETMWIGTLAFSGAVVVGTIWMAQIFGAFQTKK